MAVLAILAFLVYFYYLLKFDHGIKCGKDLVNFHKPRVSVVIAARNEERNITGILTALVNQSYPPELYEIIVANDGSEDNTATIVQEFAEKWSNLKLIEVQGREKAISPKKNALSQAIDAASGEIILLTDADCIVGRYWIEALLANFAEADMVVGFSRTQLVKWQKAPLAQKYEHFDFLAMFFAAAGAIVSGFPFSCSGQNFAYRKEVFREVGGFSRISHLISGDDVNLMQLFRQAGKKIRFAFSPHSFACTQPVQSWKQLINQRSRWASNMKWQFNLYFRFFFYLASAFLVVLLPLILLFKYWQLSVVIVILRIIFELNFIRDGLVRFSEPKEKLRFYPLWLIIQPFYFLEVACLGAFNVFSWKK